MENLKEIVNNIDNNDPMDIDQEDSDDPDNSSDLSDSDDQLEDQIDYASDQEEPDVPRDQIEINGIVYLHHIDIRISEDNRRKINLINHNYTDEIITLIHAWSITLVGNMNRTSNTNDSRPGLNDLRPSIIHQAIILSEKHGFTPDHYHYPEVFMELVFIIDRLYYFGEIMNATPILKNIFKRVLISIENNDFDWINKNNNNLEEVSIAHLDCDLENKLEYDFSDISNDLMLNISLKERAKLSKLHEFAQEKLNICNFRYTYELIQKFDSWLEALRHQVRKSLLESNANGANIDMAVYPGTFKEMEYVGEVIKRFAINVKSVSFLKLILRKYIFHMELPNDINSLRKNQMIRICKALSSDMKFLIRDCFDFMGEKPHSSWRVGFLMWLSEAINSYETTIYRKDGSCAIYHLNQMNISKLAYILFMVPDGKWTISEGPQDVIEWIKSLSGTF